MKKIDIKQNIFAILKYTICVFLIFVYWEALLYVQLHGTLNGISIWNILFMLPIATIVVCLIGWTKKLHNIDLILIVFIISIFYEANFIYYKTFGSLFSFSMIGNGTDAVTNFWWSISTTIKENIIIVILFELPIIFLIIDSIKLHLLESNYKLILHPIMLIMGVILWMLVVLALPLTGTEDYSAYGTYHSKFVDTDTASKKLGILPNTIVEAKFAIFGYGDTSQTIEVEEVVEEVKEEVKEIEYNRYEELDFTALKQLTNNDSIKNVCDYLNTLRPTEKNEYTGIFEGYNLVYICGEAFSRLAIDPIATPTLYKMATHGVVLDNYYNAFKNVTTNGEYALLSGLWPNTTREQTDHGYLTGTMGQSINKNMSEVVGNKFKSLGITPRGYHNYYGNYYGRKWSLPNMGFTCKFMGAGMEFTTEWPASDLEMMQQSVADYINDDRFCAYYMTFSGHGNYSEDNVMVQKNGETIKERLNNKNYPVSAYGYLACNYELDQAMEYLLNELEKAGKLNNTVIVIGGDHFPYYLTDAGYEALNGSAMSDDFNEYKSTCIIYNAAIDTIHSSEPCCNVDILPTILNLFNIPYDSRLYAGTDVFSNGKHVAMLYNKSFISDLAKYDSTNGNVIWLRNVDGIHDDDRKTYIDTINSYVKNKYAYSIAVEETDFYKFLFDNYEIKLKETIQEETQD